MAKNQHKKLKNTGILFELLVRTITSDILSEKKTYASNILKKYFNSKTEMGKELSLYRVLIDDKFNRYNDASMLIETTLSEYKKVDQKKVSDEKYHLIGELKKYYNVDDFFKTKINNYTLLASIYKLFEHSKGEYTNPTDIVNSKNCILEHITKSVAKEEVQNDDIEEFKKLNEDLRLLTYKLMVEKFNTAYSNNLNENQKLILREYINNVTNTTELKKFIDSQVTIIKEGLKSFIPIIKDKKLSIKLNHILENIDKNFKGNVSTDIQILDLMKYHQINEDLKNII
jgi:hypothetical protein